MGVTDKGITGAREFPPTSWSAIRHAQDRNSPEYRQHLRRLIEIYWKPVYQVIRRSWAKTDDDAKDLTQQFFGTFVEGDFTRSFPPQHGTFRGLLRSAITNFMNNAVRDAGRKKRGGDFVLLSFDDRDIPPEDDLPDGVGLGPEEMFDVVWKKALMTRAIDRLRTDLAADDRAKAFEVFTGYHLGGEDEPPSYVALGERFGLTVPQVKHHLRNARRAFRKIVTDLVREYVDDARELNQEIVDLFEML